MRYRPTSTRQLTHGGLVLTRARHHMRLLQGVVVGVGLSGLLAVLLWMLGPRHALERARNEAERDRAALARSVEQSRLATRMAEARAGELERQIDGLNQQLRAMQDELAFYRKAQENGSRR